MNFSEPVGRPAISIDNLAVFGSQKISLSHNSVFSLDALMPLTDSTGIISLSKVFIIFLSEIKSILSITWLSIVSIA